MTDQEDIYCTLVLNDGYLPGAAVLAHSLRDAGSTKKLACMIAQDNLRASSIEELQSLYNYVIPIERIGNPSPANLYLMNRPDLLYTFSKINLWKLTQYRKIVYIDADVVALRAPEELFDIQEDFAAAPDVGWPDAFNSGVMVLTPNTGVYSALRTLANAGDSFDGADQGLLNQYYEHKPWKRLSFTYNTTPSANYQYEPAYRYYKRDISMVHFIGSEKPWHRGRDNSGMPGAFQEILAKWWAVWDRHFEISTFDYIEGQRHKNPYSASSQQHQSQPDQHKYYATGYPAATTQPAPPPTTQTRASETPMSDPGERAENLDQGLVKPTPTAEQRRFSAPQMEWDATRGAPPVESKPEAAQFPSQVYEFNHDPELFRAPASYPEPPKDMWYEVPKEKPRLQEKPRAIFPWEERDVSPPTRRFIEDEQPAATVAETSVVSNLSDELEVKPSSAADPIPPLIKVNDDNPWQAFASSRNAWDDDAGIDRYVRALNSYQKDRGNPTPHQRSPSGEIPTFANMPDPEDLAVQIDRRRESLILTDFPTAMERPSLPVTPAPRRRANFWGTEGHTVEDLPEAEGVPNQTEWDPATQLENLRRNSLLATDLKLPAPRNLSNREMPSSAALIPEEDEETSSGTAGKVPQSKPAEAEIIPHSGGSSPHGLAPPSRPAGIVKALRQLSAKDTATVTEMNTALNAATESAPTVGEAVSSAPGFDAGKVDGTDKDISSNHSKHEVVVSPTEPELIEIDQRAPPSQHPSRIQGQFDEL